MAGVDELADAFLTASRVLVAVAVRSIEAAPVEVTLPQFRVLVLVASRGEQTVGQVALELGVNSSNATRVCDRLEQLGLVRRRRSSTDRRVVKVGLTDAGQDLVDAVTQIRRAEIVAVLSRMPDLDAARATRVLEGFATAAQEPEDRYWVTGT